MKAMVIYDSAFGNTEKVAQAIGQALSPANEVQVVRASEARPEQTAGLDLNNPSEVQGNNIPQNQIGCTRICRER